MSNQPSVDPSAIPQDVTLLLPRFLGRLIDGIVLAVPVIFINLVMNVMGVPWILMMAVAAILSVACFGYFVVCDTQFGTTIGKMAMGLKVVGSDGQKPGMQEACMRESFYLLQVIPFVGILLLLGAMIWIAITINNSPTGQGIHDTLGNTRVVKK